MLLILSPVMFNVYPQLWQPWILEYLAEPAILCTTSVVGNSETVYNSAQKPPVRHAAATLEHFLRTSPPLHPQ